MFGRIRGWVVGAGVGVVALATLWGVGFAESGISKGDAAVALRSARLYLQQQVWDKAKEQLEIAVKGDSANAEAHYLLGSIYADTDKFDLMNAQFEQALRLKPGKYDEQIRSWRAKVWAQHYNNGVRLYQKDKLEAAVGEFSAATQADPARGDSTYAQTYLMVGLSYMRLNETEKGIAALSKAVALDPKNRNAFLNIGIAYYNAQRPADALKAFASAAALDPGNADTAAKLLMGYETLAHATSDSARAAALLDSALAVCHRALELDPKSIQIAVAAGRLHMNRAMRLAASDKKAEAMSFYAEAEGHLRQALDLNPQDAASAFNLGLCYNQLDRPGDAIAMYRKALEIDPKDADSWMQIGLTEVRQKDFDGAVEAFKKVVEVQPDNARAYEFLSAAYANKDMPKEAKSAFDAAQALKRQGKN